MRLFTRFCVSFSKLKFAFVIWFALVCMPAYAAPNVVVSIAPIHSLVSAVMTGVAVPVLLVSGGQSPHANTLKPSAVRQLSHADLLVWVGPNFELSLTKLVAQQQNLLSLVLIEQPEMYTLPVRQSEFWQADHVSHDHLYQSESEKSGPENLDLHLWLSTKNAGEIARATEQILSKIDPKNAYLYQKNTLQVIDKIEKIKQTIGQSLEPVKEVPYLVFHDAYHYFESEFGLNPVGAVSLNPERKPGIKTLLAIEQNILLHDAKCIFHEPQFQPRLVARIAEQTGIRTGELDPIGSSIKPGPDLWFELMMSLRDNLLQCVQS